LDNKFTIGCETNGFVAFKLASILWPRRAIRTTDTLSGGGIL